MPNNSKGRQITVHRGNTPVGQFVGTGEDRTDFEEFERVLREAGVQQAAPRLAVRIHDQARAFSGVAADLGEKIAELRGRAKMYVAPFLVNAAFSIELFLKALAQQDGRAMRGHSLLELFEGLPAPARQAIEHAFANAPAELTDFEGSEDLRSLFANLDDAFVAWRYAYEGQAEGRFFSAKAASLLLATLDAAATSFIGRTP